MQMAQGAFQERVDVEMERVIGNILDPNTNPTAKRKITLTIELKPDSDRRVIAVSVVAKSALASTNPVTTALCFTGRAEDGQVAVAEMVPHTPGQMSMDGTEQPTPKILSIANV